MLLNDFGAGGGSDYALPLPQLFGEGKTMYVDMKGHGHSREHRAVVSGVVVGAFIRIHQSLSRLDLRMCSLGVDGGKALALALSCNTCLTSLSLPDNQLSDEGVEHIATALRANESCPLASINLSDNAIGVRGGSAIAEYLRLGAANLTALDGVGMSGTYFRQLRGVERVKSLELKGLGDTDSVVVGSLLAANTTLLSLDLGTSSNAMGKGWGKVVAQALASNTTLTSLNLGSNSLGDAGGVAVAESLHGGGSSSKNFTLRALDVSSNRLQLPAARALAVVLATEANLTSLNLGSNEIGEKGAVTLFEAVARNHSLTALNVSSNGWPSPPPPDKKRGESAAKSGGGGDGSGDGGGGGGGSSYNSLNVGVAADASSGGGGGGANEAMTERKAASKAPGLRPSGGGKAGGKTGADTDRAAGASQSIGGGGAGGGAGAETERGKAVAAKPGGKAVEKSSIDALAVVVRTNKTLLSLDISGNPLHEKAVKLISQAVRRNTTLTSLNGVGKSALYFKALRGKARTLDLKGCGIGSEDLSILCDLLSSNTALTSLDLSGNALGEQGGVAIAAALARNDSMTSLDLGGTGLGTAAGKALVEMLQKGQSGLTSLGLASNPLESHLRAVGFTAEALKVLGLSASQLKQGGFSAEALKEAGFKAQLLKQAGFSAQDLKEAGIPANQLKLVGFTDTELSAVGFTPQELKSKLGLEGVAAVRQLDLSVSLPMTWDRSTRDDYHLRDVR